jgi:glycosyltransferase involved in cell wall biosynthesis
MASKPFDQLTAFFPAYNEEENIAKCIETAKVALEKYAKKWEILIIVYEGSIDKTRDIVKEYHKKDERIKLIMQPKERKGIGAAYLMGFEEAAYNKVFYCDSDNQFDPQEINRFSPYIKDYDIIAGYRIRRQDPFGRIWTSRIYNFMLRRLFPLKERDVDCAFRLVNKKIFDKVKIESKTGLMTAEMLAKARIAGYKVTQVGVTHYPRTAGEAVFEMPAGLNVPKPSVVINILKEIQTLRKNIKKFKKECNYQGEKRKRKGIAATLRTINMTTKIFWNAVLFRRCPLCKSPIQEKDYPKDLTQYGMCTKADCTWGKK